MSDTQDAEVAQKHDLLWCLKAPPSNKPLMLELVFTFGAIDFFVILDLLK